MDERKVFGFCCDALSLKPFYTWSLDKNDGFALVEPSSKAMEL